MLTPIALASIFGPILVFLGIWMLLYQDNVKKVVESFQKTPAILYLTGMINLILGLTFITSFNVWKANFEILVTLLGWVFFIRGLIIFFLPNAILKLLKAQENAYVFFGLISVVWGLALSWLAFMK